MRRIVKIIAWGFVLLSSGVALCQWLVLSAAQGRLFAEATNVPDRRVALVLGCSKQLPDGRENRFFMKRINAAAQLYHAGKCPALIVSGDNSVKGYDEPTDMKEALVAAGVPAARIYCDYAGFRTLDSVVRAREVFGQTRVIIVSQRFHNERAVYLAGQRGVEAIGFNAADAQLPWLLRCKNQVRESLARVSAVLDAQVLGTKPRFLGPRVDIPPEAPTSPQTSAPRPPH